MVIADYAVAVDIWEVCEMTDVANWEANYKTHQELNFSEDTVAIVVTNNDSDYDFKCDESSTEGQVEVSSSQVNINDSEMLAKTESENEEILAEVREVGVHVEPAVSVLEEGRTLTEHNETESQSSSKDTASTFSSLLSLFSVIKNGSNSSQTLKNNAKDDICECNRAVTYQNNCLNKRLACCPFGTATEENITETFVKVKTNARETAIVDVSPKPKKARGIIPINNGLLMQEQTSQIQNCDANDLRIPKNICDKVTTFTLSPTIVNQNKLKLILEGDVSLYFLRVSKTIISKVLTSKLLRWWENHHIVLEDDCISSRTVSIIHLRITFLESVCCSSLFTAKWSFGVTCDVFRY